METANGGGFAVVNGGTGATSSRGAASNLAVPFVLSKSAIPFIKLPSGSMGNNGAVTALTALPQTYSGGAWAWFPAGAVAAGVPAVASWLWFVGSSTTAGTVFNSTYTTGPVTAGTATAFATTGPGAFTGDIGEVFGPQITVPANALGANGGLRISSLWAVNNTAGVKTLRTRYSGTAGTAYFLFNAASVLSGNPQVIIQNRNATNSQIGSQTGITGAGGGGGLEFAGTALNTSAADTTIATTLVQSMQVSGVATDYAVLEGFLIELLADGT